MRFYLLIAVLLATFSCSLFGADLDYEKAYQEWKVLEFKSRTAKSNLDANSSEIETINNQVETLLLESDLKSLKVRGQIEEEISISVEIVTLEGRIRDLKLQIDEWEQLKAKNQDSLQSICARIDALLGSAEYMRYEFLRDALNSLKKQRLDLEAQISDADEEVVSIKEDLKLLQKDLDRYYDRKNRIERRLKENEADRELVKRLREKLKGVLQRIEEYEDSKERLQKKNIKLAMQLANLISDRRKVNEDIEVLEEELSKIEVLEEIRVQESLKEKLMKDLVAIRSKIQSASLKIIDIERDLQESLAIRRDLQASIRDLKVSVFEIAQKLEKLKDSKAEKLQRHPQLIRIFEEASQETHAARKKYRKVLAAYQSARNNVEQVAWNDGRQPGLLAGREVAVGLGEQDGRSIGISKGFEAGKTFAMSHATATGYNFGLEEGLNQRELSHPEVRSEQLLFIEREVPVMAEPNAEAKKQFPSVDLRYYEPKPREQNQHPDFYTLYMETYDNAYRRAFREVFNENYEKEFYAALEVAFSLAFERGKLEVDESALYEENRSLGWMHGFQAPTLSGEHRSESSKLEYCGEKAFKGFTLYDGNLASLRVSCQGEEVNENLTLVACSEGASVSGMRLGRNAEDYVENLQIACSSGEIYSVLPLQASLSWEAILCPAGKVLGGSLLGFEEWGLEELVGVCRY